MEQSIPKLKNHRTGMFTRNRVSFRKYPHERRPNQPANTP